VRPLSWPEDHARCGNDASARPVYELSHAACAGKRSSGVHGVSCRCPRRPRKRGRVRLLPPAARGRSAPGHIGLHQLSYEGRGSRHRCPCGRHRLRRLPQAARLCAARCKNPMCLVSCARDDPRGVEPGTPGVRVVSRGVRRARPHKGARVRDLSRERAGERADGPSALSGVPRPARGRAHARVWRVPQKRSDWDPRGGRRRVRDLPSSARARGNRVASVMHELPRGGDAARFARRARPRGLWQLSCGAPRAAESRPCHLHRDMPHGQTRPSSESHGMHRVPRVPALVSGPTR